MAENNSSSDGMLKVIITGASKGIGRAIAELFAEKGFHIILCARGETALYKTMEELGTRFPQATISARPADISIKDEAQSFAKWALTKGAPAILINNAGLFEPGNVHNEPDGVLENQLAVNLLSAYHISRTVIPAMMERPAGSLGRGHIFNMCSIASLDAYPNGGAYSISKYALHGFSKNLREEMKPFGIKVTSVFPGAVLSDSWKGFDNSAKRIMEGSDIAKMIYAATTLSPQACVEDIIIRPQLGDL